ncbi:hypothetical protein HDU76_000729 [Blyttiomyces sp. JEL0837]|nr:hypothetical protein HDU76_000729 [Blyttiomyces sp. JEL0837]
MTTRKASNAGTHPWSPPSTVRPRNMVLYKLVIQSVEISFRCMKASHEETSSTYCEYDVDEAYHESIVDYTSCFGDRAPPVETSIFYNESEGRPKELSGIILLVMMAFHNDTKPNKSELSLKEIKNKLLARSESFTTIDNQVISVDSVPIRCLTSSHIRIEFQGNEATVAFVTTKETVQTIKVDTLEFALWGADVLENQELKNAFDMFMARVEAEEKKRQGEGWRHG